MRPLLEARAALPEVGGEDGRLPELQVSDHRAVVEAAGAVVGVLPALSKATLKRVSSRPAWMYWSAVGCALWSRSSPVWYGTPAGRQSRSAVRCEAPRWEEAARATWAWFGRRGRGAGKRRAESASLLRWRIRTCQVGGGAQPPPWQRKSHFTETPLTTMLTVDARCTGKHLRSLATYLRAD